MCLGHSCAANDALKQRKPYRNHLAAAAAAVAPGIQASTGDRKRLEARSGDPENRVAAETSRELLLGSSCPVIGLPMASPRVPALLPSNSGISSSSFPPKNSFSDLTRVSFNLCIKELLPKQKMINNKSDIF